MVSILIMYAPKSLKIYSDTKAQRPNTIKTHILVKPPALPILLHSASNCHKTIYES